MSDTRSSHPRVRVEGKFFQLQRRKFFAKGVAYGPFAPNAQGEAFPAPDQVRRDFGQVRELGGNLLRLYQIPPRWFLDLASEFDLRLLIDIPWHRHRCFLQERASRAEIRETVRRSVLACFGHSAVFAFSVANEIPPDIVRWSGHRSMSQFIDELIDLAKSTDPDALCTFGNFPPTEFLQPQNLDFHCFNVYLHQQKAFQNYLARLQMIAENRPVLLGETGIDSLREGEAAQAEMLGWQLETAFRSGFAGAVVFSYTDDWHSGGRPIDDWKMGITTRERVPKPAFHAVREAFRQSPYFPLPAYPRVTVVVACYNGERTLKACLDSLDRLNYPDYEVILVDDGSTDKTRQIATLYPRVRYYRHRENLGLSVARNTGIDASTGEIVAFTDADCRADPDWLYYLVSGLLSSPFVGVGGPNLLPPEDSCIAAAVMASPGGPAHVMLTDTLAEHIPGCNMAFYKWALEEIGGFDPIFRKAGDDVDLCWRLQQRGYKIGFSPPGFVWHFRRSTVRDYLKQQKGYGEAEALLIRKHPEYFNSIGGSLWQGRIYSSSRTGVVLRRSIIYHGMFGSGFFQSIYNDTSGGALSFFTSLEYYTLVLFPLAVLSVSFGLFVHMSLTAAALPLALCVTAAAQARLPSSQKRFWSRPLIGLLFLLQPLVRGLARYQGKLFLGPAPVSAVRNLKFLDLKFRDSSMEEVRFWSAAPIDRTAFIQRVLAELDRFGWPNKADAGWSNHDVEVYGNRWSRVQMTTAIEMVEKGQVLRCRLRSAWSLLALLFLSGLVAVQLMLLGFFAAEYKALWLLPLTWVGAAFWIRQRQRDLKCHMAVFLDQVGRDLHLTNLTFSRPEEPPEVVGVDKTCVPESFR